MNRQKFRISDYIIRVVVAWIGCMSTISILTACVESQISAAGLMLWTLLYTCFFVILMYYKYTKRYILILVGLAVVVIGLVLLPVLIQGVSEIIQDFQSVIQFYNTTSTGGISVSLQLSSSFSKNVTLLYFFVLYAAFESVIVVYTCSMLLAIITQLPLLVVLVSFNVIPPLICLVLIVLYVFGVAGLEHRNGNSKAAILNIAIGFVAAVICITVYPKDHYKEMDILLEANEFLMDQLDGLGNSFGTDSRVVANGGLDNGELGTVDSIEYNYEPIATVKTIDTGTTQYFPQFYGQVYGNNAWTIAEGNEDVTGNLINMIDANSDIQEALSGQSDYYNRLMKYQAQLRFRSTSQSTEYNLYVNGFLKYSFFQKLADQDNVYQTDNYQNREIMNQQTYSMYEQQYRQIVYDNYLQIPDNVRDVIGTLVGQAEVNTEEQKASYIEYVKNYLKSNYTYSVEPGRVPNGRDFTIYFLMDNKKGYCSYFATAAVLMYRYAGIPARYVEGYVLPESRISGQPTSEENIERYTDGGSTSVYTYDTYTCDIDDSCAHAWVEVYMDGYGWVTEEVTPATASNNLMDTQSLNSSDYTDTDSVDADMDTDKADSDSTGAEQQGQSQNSSNTDEQNKSSQSAGTDSDSSSNTDSEYKNSTADDTESNVTDSEGALNQTSGQLAKTGPLSGIGRFLLAVRTNRQLSSILGMLLLFLCIMMIRWLVLLIRRYQLYYGQDHTAAKVLSMYDDLEKLLKHTEFARKEEMDYEQYADMLCKKYICFRQNQMSEVVAVIMRIRFCSNSKITEKEYIWLRKNLVQIRKKVLQSQKWWKRFVIIVIFGN